MGAALHHLEASQGEDFECDMCQYGCSAKLYQDCAYEILPSGKPPAYCDVTGPKNTTYFDTPEQLQAAMYAAKHYIIVNQKKTCTDRACEPSPPKHHSGLFGALDDSMLEHQETSITWLDLIFFVMISMACTSLFCFLCAKKRVGDGVAGTFEKINVGDIGTGPSIYDSTWAR